MLTYKLKNNGYEIYKDGGLWITQYEPYIPNRSLSYEDNAKAQIEELSKPYVPQESLEQKVDRLEKRNIELENAVLELAALIG